MGVSARKGGVGTHTCTSCKKVMRSSTDRCVRTFTDSHTPYETRGEGTARGHHSHHSRVLPSSDSLVKPAAVGNMRLP